MGDQEKKIEIYQTPTHAHVFDPTEKNPKGVGILSMGLKKKKK